MKRELLFYVVFAVGLAATNWFTHTEFEREIGITGRGIQPVMLGIWFAGFGVWFLGRRAYKLAREMLDAGTRFGKAEKLISLKPVLLLLPLLAHFHTTSAERLMDGTVVHRSYGYGTDVGWVLFLLGTALIILFQIVVRLERAKLREEMQGAPAV